jgi:hypothetical protein
MGILRAARQQQWVNDDRHLSIEEIVGFFMRGAANLDGPPKES